MNDKHKMLKMQKTTTKRNKENQKHTKIMKQQQHKNVKINIKEFYEQNRFLLEKKKTRIIQRFNLKNWVCFSIFTLFFKKSLPFNLSNSSKTDSCLKEIRRKKQTQSSFYIVYWSQKASRCNFLLREPIRSPLKTFYWVVHMVYRFLNGSTSL